MKGHIMADKNTAPVEEPEVITAEEAGADEGGNTFAGGNVVESVRGLNDPSSSGYSSIVGDDLDTKLRVFDAMQSSTPVEDYLGQTLNLKDVIVTVVHLANQNTGIVAPAPRIVLIDDEGVARHATSQGLMQALTTLFGVLGTPDKWVKPLPIRVVQKRGAGANRYFTIELAK